MTRLPVESRLAVDRPDLPEYELNEFCPISGDPWNLENHHIFRRSAGYPSWWVELEDGEVIGNRIRLSQQAHERVTVNKARLSYEGGVYYWIEGEERSPLRWQPPTMHQRSKKDNQWVSGGHEKFETPVVSVRDVEPGHDCPTCRRRVPLPKKATSPDTKVFSTRVPVADVDTFKEILDAAAEHAGLKPKAHFAYWTILAGLTLILQAPREDLPDVG